MKFDSARANEPIEFVQLLKLCDDFYGQPFLLQEWQKEVLQNVYGTVKENGSRQYQYAYLEIPKKNGKTTLIASLGIYHLVCDGPGGQIYCCAAEREQASLVYKAAKQMIEQDPALDAKQGGFLNVIDSKKQIENIETGTFLKVLSAEAYSKHGINPTVIIFDELHAQQKRDLWDTMTFGAGSARKEPLWWIITTAGNDPDRKSIGWEIHEKARKIRDGELLNPSWYVKIYGAPDDADIYDEEVWLQVNPSLGHSIDIETLRSEALDAKESASVETLFRWLRLNQWVSLKRKSWLNLTLWDDTESNEWTVADMRGLRCYLGVDLSSTRDLTAIALLFPPQQGIPEWRFAIEAFIPEETMAERIKKDKVPYDRFADQNLLTITEGSAVDYEAVQAAIERLCRIYKVPFVCVDKWNCEMLIQILAKKGIKSVEIPQTIAGMSPGMKALERLFLLRQISHERNALGRWTFGNVVPAEDGNANKKPMKDLSFEKIDPIVALITAMSAAVRLEEKASVYEDRGMRNFA